MTRASEVRLPGADRSQNVGHETNYFCWLTNLHLSTQDIISHSRKNNTHRFCRKCTYFSLKSIIYFIWYWNTKGYTWSLYYIIDLSSEWNFIRWRFFIFILQRSSMQGTIPYCPAHTRVLYFHRVSDDPRDRNTLSLLQLRGWVIKLSCPGTSGHSRTSVGNTRVSQLEQCPVASGYNHVSNRIPKSTWQEIQLHGII